MLARPNPIVEQVIGCAIQVHRALGPGLLESSYAACLVAELCDQGVSFRHQVPVPISYKGAKIDCSYRVDLVVEDFLLLELKSVERLLPIHDAQVMTYLRLLDLHQGIIMNFNAPTLVKGLRNILR